MGRVPKSLTKRSKAQQQHFAAARNNNGSLKPKPQKEVALKPAQEKVSNRGPPSPRKALAETKNKLANTQRKVRRLIRKQDTLQQTVQSMKESNTMLSKKLEVAEQHRETLEKQKDRLETRLAAEIKAHHELKQQVMQERREHREEIRAFKKRHLRADQVREHAIKRARRESKPPTFKLMNKRAYSVTSRKIMRMLVASGCARSKVGHVLSGLAAELGVKMNSGRSASRRTVSRAVLEGYIAAKCQIGFEISKSQGKHYLSQFSNRGVNFESRHIALRVPDYKTGDLSIDMNSTPQIRLLCVDSTVDHTADGAVKGFVDCIEESMKYFNASPYAQILKKNVKIRHFFHVLKAMNGDHASKEKSAARGMGDKKHQSAIEDLGEDRLLSMPVGELVEYLGAWNQKKIAQAGGMEEWNKLSQLEQAKLDKKLMQEIIMALGQEEYNALSPEDRRTLDLFIWAGCCMHKDQNSFRAGNAEMMLEWVRLGIPPPILLANKANSATLRKILEPGGPNPLDTALSEDEQRAFEQTTRGGVKTVALAGAILNNKDDKKGQGDKHVHYFQEKVDKAYTHFPDTSNTRFGSHGDAAADLIQYLDSHIEYLHLVRLSKQAATLTQIECNVLKALGDPATLTELCAMVLYTQAVSKPYMRAVRGPKSDNILDLLVSEDISHVNGTLDGKEWDNPKAIEAVVKLMSSLPHLKALTVAFFRGALATWERFSSEFAPGGLIDEASAEEKHLAWMPATNDVNEGALGGYRVVIRGKPSMTLHQYNAMAMFQRNNTQDYMDVVFTEADHLYVMREARIIDASGLEKKRRKAIVDYRVEVARIRKGKEEARQTKIKADAERLSKVVLITKICDIPALTVAKLGDQIDAIRFRGLPDVPPKSRFPVKLARQEALEEIFIRYQAFILEKGDAVPNVDMLSGEQVVVRDEWEQQEEAEMDED
ncbi:hypothetical protein BDZ97DRAFT_1778312 [Flammula alnicola]|nr:hypothetical protein BDZ97DRAFT_1883626 [Flammula alnicola]KAF8954620.1 hypothetical protein BDZ97DRAFT_1864044 [Flammula alnicola]KAF8972911.1 hypothetical protein BDZ97DRAFT_1778312 [Flammula alnicola]